MGSRVSLRKCLKSFTDGKVPVMMPVHCTLVALCFTLRSFRLKIMCSQNDGISMGFAEKVTKRHSPIRVVQSPDV